MKILHINTERTWRGGERQTLLTLQGLLELGTDAHLLCRSDCPLEREALAAGVSSSRIHAVSGSAGALVFLLRRGDAYDVLHAQTAKAQGIAVLASQLRPGGLPPLVYTRRVDFPPRGKAAAWKYRNTTAIVAISKAISNILESHNISVNSVIYSATQPFTVNATAAQRLRQEHSLHGRPVIGTAAALVPHKDPITMVRAAAQLVKIRSDAVFLHFGEGELQHTVANAIQTEGLGDSYRLMGFEPRLQNWWGVFDLFAMSSSEEGLGSVVLDAFMAQTPVVSTSAGGLEELVTGRGLVCPVGDAGCLAIAMGRLLDDKAMRNTLTAAAKEYVAQRHDAGGMAAAYLKMYQGIID